MGNFTYIPDVELTWNALTIVRTCNQKRKEINVGDCRNSHQRFPPSHVIPITLKDLTPRLTANSPDIALLLSSSNTQTERYCQHTPSNGVQNPERFRHWEQRLTVMGVTSHHFPARKKVPSRNYYYRCGYDLALPREHRYGDEEKGTMTSTVVDEQEGNCQQVVK